MSIFDRFRRKPRYNPQLGIAAAAVVSEEIVRAALRASKELEDAVASDSPVPQDESHWWQTVFEFAYLFLHIADRFAFQVIGSENRSSFIDDLASMTFDTTAEVLLREPDEKLRSELKASLLASLNRRNTEYGSCQKLLPTGDDGFKGTLFWEFGKVIAETRRRPKNIGVMMAASSVAFAALQLLQLKDALQRTLE